MAMDPVSLVELLNEIGARNAIGRIDLVENRFVGIKSRGCYETPGGTLLIAAHRELEALCLERDVAHFKQHIGSEVRRAGLLRPVVHAAARSPRRLRREHAERDDRFRHAVALQGKCFHRQPRIRVLALPHRSFFVHHGRQLRPERCRRIHSHPRACRRGRAHAPVRVWRSHDEDVVGKVPAAAGPRFRTLAAIVRFRSPADQLRTRRQRRSRARLEERGSADSRRVDQHPAGPRTDRGTAPLHRRPSSTMPKPKTSITS